MSRQAIDPVDAAFQRIVALTPEDRLRLRERMLGWQLSQNPIADALLGKPAPRKRERKLYDPHAKAYQEQGQPERSKKSQEATTV